MIRVTCQLVCKSSPSTRLDALVNNAVLGGQTPVVDMTDDEWE
jgi:NAD(P)-dependent dehydrogenase (short-subunit alcohol dehydrogenase family)